MPREKRLLVDVAMRKLPWPIVVASRENAEGQSTVANVSVSARINDEFEANWIDKFIKVIHQHRDRIGTKSLQVNILDYLREMKATTVRIDLEYPFFMEKKTPVSKENCLLRYMCTYSAKVSSLDDQPKIIFSMEVPAITTDPASDPDKTGGLYGQLSVVTVKVESQKDVFAEDIVDIVDRHALSPVYSYMRQDDKIFVIQKVHSEKKSSVVMTDEIKEELARNQDYSWFAAHCANFGMLHSYSTMVGTEKGMWVPLSGYEDDDI